MNRVGERREKLTPKQVAFAREYVVDHVGQAAAIRAGYAPKCAKVTASKLLTDPRIAALVNESLDLVKARTGLSAEYVLNSLQEVAERCMQRAPVMIPSQRGMVQAKDEEGRDVWQFDSKGANRALELLGKHLCLFTDKLDVTAKVKMLPREERAKRIAELVATAVARSAEERLRSR